GKAVFIMGELSNQAARMRTQDVHDFIKTDECKWLEIVEEQTSNWDRTQGADLMTNWLSGGILEHRDVEITGLHGGKRVLRGVDTA
ncbi:hypothetical protein ACC760_38640, partial [Rhizobium ruizarguesonis]